MCEVCLLSGVSEFLSVPGQEVKKKARVSKATGRVSDQRFPQVAVAPTVLNFYSRDKNDGLKKGPVGSTHFVSFCPGLSVETTHTTPAVSRLLSV